MASVTSAQAARTFHLLSDATVGNHADLQEFASDSDAIDTDEEVESEPPIYDQFYENWGASTIIQIKCVSLTEFYATWCASENSTKERNNAEWGAIFAYSSRCLFSDTCRAKTQMTMGLLGQDVQFKMSHVPANDYEIYRYCRVSSV